MARALPKQTPIKGVEHVLIVASGKGGVGKSTTAVNLATALKVVEPKKSIGLLDADVFGPSIPLMMNVRQSPTIDEANLLVPLVNYGVKCMSMGFLVGDKSPIIWRGLMVMSALEKLLRRVAWNPLDYLIIDTPPGTGDTHLSLIQNLPIAGALLVTTPQKAALEVTGRGATMFKKLNVPIVGIVENMGDMVCPNCTAKVSLFGDATEAMAIELDTKVLLKVPLDKRITEGCDNGRPIVLAAPESAQAAGYKRLAKHLVLFCDKRMTNKD